MDISAGISDSTFDEARHILSEGFTVAITDRFEDVVSLAFNIEALRSYDYQIVEYDLFKMMTDIPHGLIARAESLVEQGQPHDFVVFDPIDDENGYLLLGDALDIAKEACEYISNQEPEEGPLSPDALVRASLEGN